MTGWWWGKGTRDIAFFFFASFAFSLDVDSCFLSLLLGGGGGSSLEIGGAQHTREPGDGLTERRR